MTFRRMTFCRYDVASNATFGCSNVLLSTTFSRENLSGTTFSRKCQPSFSIERHLRSLSTVMRHCSQLDNFMNMWLTILNCQGAVKIIKVLRIQHRLSSEI